MIFLTLLFSSAFAMSKGEYLVRLGGCIHCHSSSFSEPLAGGRRLVTPFGDFYTPNITPDHETGIGRWSEEDFSNALDGKAPDGSLYYPVFPYRTYSNISAEDRAEMFRYLKSLKPIRKTNLPHEIGFPYDWRWLLNFWQTFYSSRAGKLPGRGAYLVEALAHCTECHTPRDRLGGLRQDRWLAGSSLQVEGVAPPNITPEPRTGLGNWSLEDWEKFLATGVRPSGRAVGGEMAWVIYQTSVLTPEDRKAVAEYLRGLKPVYNRVGGP